MGYTVQITRNPQWTRRPGTPITLDQWFSTIQEDEELEFDVTDATKKYGTSTANWLAHPNQSTSPDEHALHFAGGDITAKYPDEPLLQKMVLIARKLNAIVMGDNSEIYDLDPAGKLIDLDHPPKLAPEDFPTFYGIGTQPCKKFTELFEQNSLRTMEFYQWYMGFLSALNEAWFFEGRGKRLLRIEMNNDTITSDQAFIRGYCLDNPEKPFLDAAKALVRYHTLRLGPLRSVKN